MRAVNASLSANLAVLDEVYTDLLKLLRTLEDADVNWVPPVADTNSIAVVTTHVVGSNARWLSRATGHEVATDRPSEFRAHASCEQLIAHVEQARVDAHAWLAALDTIDPGETRETGQAGWTVSAAWCVEHALVHTGEHWGQIQLTRQLRAALAQDGTKG
jgi:hypothetical protein